MNDADACPVDPEMPHIWSVKPVPGVIPRVHTVLAVELKPVPVTLTTVPLFPCVGDRVICALTLKRAHAPIGMSFTGVPLTVTFQFTSVVASDPTTKLPVATWELIVHVKLPISRLFDPGANPAAADWTTHAVSVPKNPVARNVTVVPVGPLVGNSVRVPFVVVTMSVASAKSALLPVTRITYDPGATFPIVNDPSGMPVPTMMLHAGFATALPDVGLVMEHVESTNEKLTPVTMTLFPILPGKPVVAFSRIDGPKTVKVASMKTPEGFPVTRTVYGPGATLATTKLPLKLPPMEPMITQLLVPVTVPDIVQVVSPPPTEPFTLTVRPLAPEDGVIEMAVMVNVARANPPLGNPLTMTV